MVTSIPPCCSTNRSTLVHSASGFSFLPSKKQMLLSFTFKGWNNCLFKWSRQLPSSSPFIPTHSSNPTYLQLVKSFSRDRIVNSLYKPAGLSPEAVQSRG